MKSRCLLIFSLIFFMVASLLGEAVQAENPTPEPGKIVFYRPKKAKGAAIRFNIEDGGRPFSSLSNGQVIEKVVEPGEHNFSVSGPSLDGRDFLSVNVQAGEVQYVKCEIKWGWPAGRPKFELVSQSQGESAVARLK